MHGTHPWPVKVIGIALWTMAILYAAYLFLPAWMGCYTKGRVVCAQCGVREYRTQYGGLVLRREPVEWEEQAWWDRIVPANHMHDWHAVGCWGERSLWSSSVSCVMIYEDDLFFASLPRFRDQDLARAVALRLGTLEPEDRWNEMVDSAYLQHVEPLVRPSNDTANSQPYEMQVRDYQEWRDSHPRWHDLFPATLIGFGRR
jgi:hypothetical protein